MRKKKPKKPEYWDNINNIQKHLKKIIKKNKRRFPTKEELRGFPYGIEIETAIMRLGMTLDEFRIQMGVKASDAEEQDKMLDLLMNSTESFLDTVRERKVDDAEFAAERNCRFGPPPGHVPETGASSAGEDQGEGAAG